MEHQDCAAIDISKRNLPDVYRTKKYLESLNLKCESHSNFSSSVLPIGSPDTHFHCVDKFYLEQFGRTVKKLNTRDNVNRTLSYAYNKSKDKLFVKMLVAENGEVNPRLQSRVPLEGGSYEKSWGVCQIHCPSNPGVCGSPSYPTRPEFWDPIWQVDTCYDLYQGGTTFYGLKRLQNEPEFNAKVEALLTFS